jgi:hypothetical protein
MKYSLDVHVICNNQTIIDALKAKVPAKTDAQLWDVEYHKEEGTDIDGNKFLSAEVRFNQEVDRTVAWNWLKNKVQEAGILPQILTGSYLRVHKCYHDEVPERACEITDVWSK